MMSAHTLEVGCHFVEFLVESDQLGSLNYREAVTGERWGYGDRFEIRRADAAEAASAALDRLSRMPWERGGHTDARRDSLTGGAIGETG
jgi:hypothetical protein